MLSSRHLPSILRIRVPQVSAGFGGVYFRSFYSNLRLFRFYGSSVLFGASLILDIIRYSVSRWSARPGAIRINGPDSFNLRAEDFLSANFTSPESRWLGTLCTGAISVDVFLWACEPSNDSPKRFSGVIKGKPSSLKAWRCMRRSALLITARVVVQRVYGTQL